MPRLPAPLDTLNLGRARAIAFKQPDRLFSFTPVNNSLSPFTECLFPLHVTHTYTMAGRALPSHLKPSAAEGGEGGFAPRHHGKTQSHVVSAPLFCAILQYSATVICFYLSGCGCVESPVHLCAAPRPSTGGQCCTVDAFGLRLATRDSSEGAISIAPPASVLVLSYLLRLCEVSTTCCQLNRIHFSGNTPDELLS